MATKDIVDIISKLVAMAIAIPGARLAYKRWFKPAKLGIALDSVFLLGPGGQDDIATQDLIFAAQLRVYNSGAEPEAMAEIYAFTATLMEDTQTCNFTAYASLKPLKMASGAPGQPAQFRIEVKELAHAAVLKKEDQAVLHFLFIPDQGQAFQLRQGTLRLKFDINIKLGSGDVQQLELIRYRKVGASEVKAFNEDAKLAWLSWHLSEQAPA